MGTIISNIEEQRSEALYQAQKKHIACIAARIVKIEPGSPDFHDLVWLMNNREKILAVMKLIQLIKD